MAHGFSAVKEMYLDRSAEAFAAAGRLVHQAPDLTLGFPALGQVRAEFGYRLVEVGA